MSKLISYIYISILSLAVAGCSDSDSLDANNTPNSDPNADETLPGDEDASTTDRTDEVYTPSRLLKVEIELNPNDWDALRSQERTGEDLKLVPIVFRPLSRLSHRFRGSPELSLSTASD